MIEIVFLPRDNSIEGESDLNIYRSFDNYSTAGRALYMGKRKMDAATRDDVTVENWGTLKSRDAQRRTRRKPFERLAE